MSKHQYHTSENVSNGKTVVLVERWLNPNFFHRKWVQYLQKKGFIVHFVSLPLGKGTFDESAKKLSSYIDSHNLSNITLVGISSGGISCLIYLQKYDGWKRVANFISIATPFRGTFLAWFLYLFKSCRELLPNCALLQELAGLELRHLNRIICVMGKFDELVPLSSQSVPNTKKIILPIWGHNNMHISKKETYDLIAEYAAKE